MLISKLYVWAASHPLENTHGSLRQKSNGNQDKEGAVLMKPEILLSRYSRHPHGMRTALGTISAPMPTGMPKSRSGRLGVSRGHEENIRCFGCGIMGHRVPNCPYGGAAKGLAHRAMELNRNNGRPLHNTEGVRLVMYALAARADVCHWRRGCWSGRCRTGV